MSHISKEHYEGDIYCYNVPNHLFVTRRNGKVTIQGNTTNGSTADNVSQALKDSIKYDLDVFTGQLSMEIPQDLHRQLASEHVQVVLDGVLERLGHVVGSAAVGGISLYRHFAITARDKQVVRDVVAVDVAFVVLFADVTHVQLAVVVRLLSPGDVYPEDRLPIRIFGLLGLFHARLVAKGHRQYLDIVSQLDTGCVIAEVGTTLEFAAGTISS